MMVNKTASGMPRHISASLPTICKVMNTGDTVQALIKSLGGRGRTSYCAAYNITPVGSALQSCPAALDQAFQSLPRSTSFPPTYQSWSDCQISSRDSPAALTTHTHTHLYQLAGLQHNCARAEVYPEAFPRFLLQVW